MEKLEHAKYKHFLDVSKKEYCLKVLDPEGYLGKWMQKIIEMSLTGKGSVKKLPTGELMEIIEKMPKTDGTGTLNIGVRLFRKNGTDVWILNSILTGQF